MTSTADQSRTRTIVGGIGALAAILASLVGLPLLLWKFGGSPLPASVPSPGEIGAALTRPDDGSLFLSGLRLVGWLAWAGWALSLLSCIPAQITGRRPPRLPGLSWSQARAGALTGAVSAMIALLATTAAVTPANAAPADAATLSAPASGGPVATAPGSPAPAGPTDPKGPAAQVAHQVTVAKGDTLSGIAKRELGAGSRYRELYAASRDTVQPGGRHLTNPNRIYPGWTITVPGTGPATPPAPTTTNDRPDGAAGEALAPQANPAEAAAAAGAQTQPDQAPAGVPATSSQPAPAASASEPAPAAAAATTASDEDSRQTVEVSALAAAGLLGLLVLARARQSRRRGPGRRIAMPHGRPAATEADLRAAADPLAVSDLNRALRTLAGRAATLGAPMPGLRAARITHEELEFYLVDAEAELPAPFTCLSDGTWALHRSDLGALLTEDEAAHIPAPYPTLVSVGYDEHQALLLLHLEELGALGLTGDPQLGREVLTAITAELIASSWADDIRITLVRLMPELVDALGSDRATYTDTLDTALAGLEYTARVHREALHAADQPDATQARVAGVVDETWTPHLLVIAGGVTPEQRDRLAHLVATHPRVAIAILTADTDPVGEWNFEVASGAGGQIDATLAPVPLTLTPQRLTNEQYVDLVSLFATTDDPDVDGPEWASHIDDQPIDLTTLTPADPPLDNTGLDQIEAATTSADHTADDPPARVSADTGTTASTDSQADEAQEASPGTLSSPPQTQESAAAHADEEGADALILAHPATQPQLRLLGPVPTLIGQRGKRPGSPNRSLEVLAYLALHPGQPYQSFDAAIFPQERVTATKRNQYVSNTRSWVGYADDGHPYVALVPEAGYCLADDTAVDWWLFHRWITPSVTAAATDKLRAALALVDGQPFSGVEADRYQWAMSDQKEILASIADVAHELARRATSSGDARTAAWAAAKGLDAEPVSEALWRDAITAAYLSGNQQQVRDVIARCRAVLEPLGPDLEDETQALINQSLQMAAHA